MMEEGEMGEFVRKTEEIPLADVIIAFQQFGETADFEKLAGASNIVENITGDGYTVKNTWNAATGFVVGDDSMFPTLPENSQVCAQHRLRDQNIQHGGYSHSRAGAAGDCQH